jgi:MFS family permease
MIQVLASAWALLLGMYLLMIGNGLQGTLLGLRGQIEAFSTLEISAVMSAYYVGFLFASRMAPPLIARVGHVRVFSALGSTISAVLILYPVLAEPWAWVLFRVVIGFCFCGVYITAESWLNAAASNENRGKALSLYMVVQMGGIVTAQYLVAAGDVAGYVVFIVPSVLVSLAFAPVLLSARQVVPPFAETKPLAMRRLLQASPLACAGMFLLGSVFAAQFGMTAVYGSAAGLSERQITLMVSLTYLAALVLQYPIGLCRTAWIGAPSSWRWPPSGAWGPRSRCWRRAGRRSRSGPPWSWGAPPTRSTRSSSPTPTTTSRETTWRVPRRASSSSTGSAPSPVPRPWAGRWRRRGHAASGRSSRP